MVIHGARVDDPSINTNIDHKRRGPVRCEATGRERRGVIHRCALRGGGTRHHGSVPTHEGGSSRRRHGAAARAGQRRFGEAPEVKGANGVLFLQQLPLVDDLLDVLGAGR